MKCLYYDLPYVCEFVYTYLLMSLGELGKNINLIMIFMMSFVNFGLTFKSFYGVGRKNCENLKYICAYMKLIGAEIFIGRVDHCILNKNH